MIASRTLLSKRIVVGIGIKDLEGARAALAKVIRLAGPDDKLFAVHVPKMVPEMLLSSISDPSDEYEEIMAVMASTPERAGADLQKKIKKHADAEMAALGKTVDIAYQVEQSASNTKSALLKACKKRGAEFLFIGPGVDGSGSMPPYAIQHAKSLTVCIVRDHIE